MLGEIEYLDVIIFGRYANVIKMLHKIMYSFFRSATKIKPNAII